MYGVRPPRLPTKRASNSQVEDFLALEGLWRKHWPFIAANIIAFFMLIFGLAVAALEAAELDKGSDYDTTNVKLGGTTSRGSQYRIGVGIWSGAIVVVAAVCIFVINCGTSVKHWATISASVVSAALVFSVVNFSINAKVVRVGVISGAFHSNDSSEYTPYRLAAAQIPAASLSFITCVAFFIMFAVVKFIQIPKGRKLDRVNLIPNGPQRA